MYVYINNLNVFIQVATPLEEIATLTKENVPRIIYLTSGQYYIIAKKDVLTELDNMSDAIFFGFPSITYSTFSTQRSCTTLVFSFKTIFLVYQMALVGQLLITLLLETYASNKLSIIITP